MGVFVFCLYIMRTMRKSSRENCELMHSSTPSDTGRILQRDVAGNGSGVRSATKVKAIILSYILSIIGVQQCSNDLLP